MDVGWASKVQSDRFLNPNNMVCPIWNGLDTAGREVCPDSFVTKRAGCNSADDRVVVENALRPQYMEYINLNANGIGGNVYGNTAGYNSAGTNRETMKNIHKITGQFGEQFQATRQVTCHGASPSTTAYQTAMAQESKARREQAASNNGFNATQNMYAAGM